MCMTMPAKHPYKGGSKPAQTNCGVGRCPANVRLIKILHYQKNKSSYKERAENRPVELVRKYRSNWKKRNVGVVNSNTASRKKHIRKATPNWLTDEHRDQIKWFYSEAQRLRSETGIPHDVDHIVPVRGELVSGLHVPWNLRVIPSIENQKKNRKLLEI